MGLLWSCQCMGQGHPTTECFQIRQKCLRQMVFSLLQKPVWLIWSWTIYLFGCLRGTLVVTKVFGRFFVSSETQLPLTVRSEVRGHEVALLSLENYTLIIQDVLSLYRKFQQTFFNNNRNIVYKNVNDTTSENRS